MITFQTSLEKVNELLNSCSVRARFTNDNFGGKIEYKIDQLPWILRTKGDVSFTFSSGQNTSPSSSPFMANAIQKVNSFLEFGGFYIVPLNDGVGVCVVYSYNLPRLLPVRIEQFVESIRLIDESIFPVFVDLFERSTSA